MLTQQWLSEIINSALAVKLYHVHITAQAVQQYNN